MMFRHTLLAFTAAFLVAQTPVPEVKKVDAAKAETPKTAQAPEAKAAQKVEVKAEAKPAEKVEAKPAEKAEAPKEEKKEAEEPAKPKEDKVMARLGNRLIKDSDFETFTSMALNQQQRMQMEMIPSAKEQFKKNFLDFLVREAKARKEGLDQNADVQKKFRLMEGQVLNMELINRDGQELQKKATVNDDAIKAYYDKHLEDFKTKATFNARHILISVKEGDKEKTEEAAKAKIAKIQEALKAGKKLSDLTKEYSDDPGSKDKGGLYENINYGSFVAPFDEAVKKQEIGKVGEPVKSNYGYHIIQVEKRTEAEQKPFDKVKEQCKQKAQTEKQDEIFNTYMSALKKEVDFEEGENVKVPAVKPEAKKATKKAAKKAKK